MDKLPAQDRETNLKVNLNQVVLEIVSHDQTQVLLFQIIFISIFYTYYLL